VLLLNPPSSLGTVFRDPVLPRCPGVPSKAPYVWPPIGLGYIASFLENDFNVSIIDAQAEGLSFNETLKKASSFDLVFLNCGLLTAVKDIEIASRLREKGAKVCLLGEFASFFATELVANGKADFVIIGEPEQTALDLAKALFFEKSLASINGLCWGKKPVLNQPRKPLKNIDLLPFPRRDLFKGNYYDILARGKKITPIISSRGCPFSCNFCSAHSIGPYRERTPKNVLLEVDSIIEQGFDEVLFWDDTFTVNRKRVLEICNGLKERNINWRCLSRVDTVDSMLLREMRKAGCYQIHFGVESGSQRTLNAMQKGITLKQAKKAFTECNSLGIETVAFFILGFPGEKAIEARKTIHFARELNADFATFNAFTPLPGTRFFSFKFSENWSDFNFAHSFSALSGEELSSLIATAYRSFYFRPGYFFSRIKKSGFFYVLKQNLFFWLHPVFLKRWFNARN